MEEGSREVVRLVDDYFNAFNAGWLRDACHVYLAMLEAGATIGVSVSGALTPAGLSSIITPRSARCWPASAWAAWPSRSPPRTPSPTSSARS
jgi:hypothetical protein